MKKLLLLITPILLANINSRAQTPDWSTVIAPILYDNCVSCHRPSGIGPFELITYQGAVDKAKSISGAVTTGYMPPWPADPNYNRLAHERLLSKADIAKIQNWVAGNTPEGDPNMAPTPPTFNADGDIAGTPDLVSKIPQFTSTASSGDVYQCFVVPSGLSADKYIESFEAIPGNRDIVHHVLVYADTTGVCANLDANHAGPGYVSFGGPGTDNAIMLGGWVPGTPPLQLPSGFGIRIPKNADIVIQIHYPAGSSGQTDTTKIRFFFSQSSSVRNVRIDPLLNHLDPTGLISKLTPNDGLKIPANQTKLYTEEAANATLIAGGPVTLMGIAPHMHLIGRSINCYGVSGKDTLKVIDIPSWDFSWQGFYMLRKPMKIPLGTKFYSEAFFDNTGSNPFNPSNPPQTVTAGEATTDEMMLTYFIWTRYQSGDENIVIDNSPLVPLSAEPVSGFSPQELFTPYPNPSRNQLYVKYFIRDAGKINISITDMQGKLVGNIINQQQAAGYHVQPYSVADLPSGTYLLQLSTDSKATTKKITIQH